LPSGVRGRLARSRVETRNNGLARFNETGKTNWDYSGI
jgi:hypothetical protein